MKLFLALLVLVGLADARKGGGGGSKGGSKGSSSRLGQLWQSFLNHCEVGRDHLHHQRQQASQSQAVDLPTLTSPLQVQ